MLNNIVGYWAYIQGTYIQGGLYSGGAYIWNEVTKYSFIDTFWVHIEQLIRWVLMSIQW
jgi:hypothetical protein